MGDFSPLQARLERGTGGGQWRYMGSYMSYMAS